MKKILLLCSYCCLFVVVAKAQLSVVLTATHDTLTCVTVSSELTPQIANGVQPYTYAWSDLSTTSSLVVNTAGIYTVTVTDAASHSATAMKTIISDNIAPSVSITKSNDFFDCNTATVTLTAVSSLPNATYAWSSGGSTTNTLAVTSSDYYFVTVTNIQNGCTSTNFTYVGNNFSFPSITISPQAAYQNCVGNGTAAFTATVLDGDSYAWNTGNSTTVLSTNIINTYTVTATNSYTGCTATATANFYAGGIIPTVSFNTTGVVCTTSPLCATSTPGANFSWNSGENSACIQGVQSGVYMVTATTGQGCTTTASLTVGVIPNTLSVSLSNPINTTTCYGVDDGSATSTATGGTAPYRYHWVTGGVSDTVATAMHLRYGTNRVFVTDANGCTKQESIDIGSNNSNNLQVSAAVTTLPTCSQVGFSTGYGTGGAPPYSYSWSTGYQSQNFIWPYTLPTTYTVTVQDANGCTAKTPLFVSDSSVHRPTLIITQSAPYFGCGGNNNIQLTVSGGLPNCGYYWFSGNNANGPSGTSATVTPYPGTNIYTYTVRMSGSTYCTTTKTITIAQTNTYSPTVVFDDCTPQNTGSIGLSPNTSTPTMYRWNTGEITPSLQNLPSGWYSVTATVANCDTTHYNFNVLEVCKTTISGYVLKDNNTNCMRDTSDTPMAYNGYVALRNTQTQQIYTLYLDTSGFYSAIVDTGNYELNFFPQTNSCVQYAIACGSANGIRLQASNTGVIYANQNFYLQTGAIFQPDLSVSTWQQTARPAFPRQFNFYINNTGTGAAINTIATFTHDAAWGNLTMLNGSAPPVTSTNTTKSWNLGTLAPNTTGNFNFTMELPQTMPLNGMLTNTLTITNDVTDCALANNLYQWSTITTNSFDPNDKTLLNAQDDTGNILNDDAPLTYQIRFQNTGTDTAYTVVVRDTFDLTHLDKNTFKVIGASHNMQTEWVASNIIEFRFPTIYLVDSFHNEPASHGWLQFSILRKPNTPLYSQVNNSAAIFFDYNDAVLTNTVRTKFVPFLATDKLLEPYLFQIQPNPTTGIMYVTHDDVGQLTLTDILGKTMLSQSSIGKNTLLDISAKPAGTYFLTLKTNRGSTTKKVVKID